MNANEHNNMTYLHVDKLNVDLVVDKLKMGIKRVIGINRFISKHSNIYNSLIFQQKCLQLIKQEWVEIFKKLFLPKFFENFMLI